MLRLVLFLFQILLLGAPLMAADLVPCRDQAGRLFVTDKPDLLPPGCALLGAHPPRGSFSVAPSPDALASPAARGAMAALSRSEQYRRNRAAVWKQRAEALSKQYRESVNEVYRSGRSRERQVKRRQLAIIQEKKRALMVEVRQSNRLNLRREIGELLSEIPE